jgi:hypothetical protein
LPSSEAMVLLTVEPVVAFALAAVVLGEILNPAQWLGAIAVLGGVVLLTIPGQASVRGEAVGPASQSSAMRVLGRARFRDQRAASDAAPGRPLVTSCASDKASPIA